MLSKKAPEGNAAYTSDGQEKLLSQTIDWLRFPLAVAVVFIHSWGRPVEIDLASIHAHPWDGMSVYNLLRICFSHALTHIAVPTFFLFSGFLFFRKWQNWDRQLWMRKIKTRFHSLFIPYLCWNLIAIMVAIGMKIGAFIVKGKPLSGIPLWLQENGWLHLLWDSNVWAEDRLNWLGMATPMSGPYVVPLWFLRDLIVVTALTPLIYWFLRKFKHYGVLALSLAYVSGIWPIIPGLTVTSVFFFCAGAYFSIYGKNLVTEIRKVKNSSWASAILLLLALIWFDSRNTQMGNLLYPFYIISGVCAAVNLAAKLLESGKVQVSPLLSQSTFFIYATHTILVLELCSKMVNRIIVPTTPIGYAICYFLIPLLTAAICLGLYLLLKRICPRVLRVLTGDR